MRNHVDQFATTHPVHHDRTVRSDPQRVVRRINVPHRVDRHKEPPAHFPGELRRVRTDQACAHGRVDAIGTDDDIGFDFVSICESSAGAMVVSLDTHAPGPQLDSSGGQRSGKNIKQVRSVRRAAYRAKTSLEIATLWCLCQDATAPAIAHNLIFGLPCDRSNRGFEVERPQCLHRIRMKCYPSTDFLQLGCRFEDPGFEAALL